MGKIAPSVRWQFVIGGEDVAAGYQLFTYEAGTTTKKNTFTTSVCNVANSNPIELDANGSATIFLDGLYKFALYGPDETDPPTGSPVFTVDNINGVNDILDNNGNYILKLTAVPNSVNYWEVKPSISGSPPVLKINGTDALPDGVILDKNDNEVVKFVPIDSAVNYLQLKNAATGTNPIIDIEGSDSNVGITIKGKGTGGQIIGDYVDSTTVLLSEDSRTNSVARPVIIRAQTSDTPASGIGTGLLLQSESADETPSNFGAIDFVASDVTAGSEDTYLSVKLRVAGAALAEAFRFAITSAFSYIFTGSPAAQRTITLPDYDVTNIPAGNASSSDQETGTSTTKYVTPAVQQSHPSACKAWAKWTSVTTTVVQASYNIAGVTDGGTGDTTLTIATDFSSADYCYVTNNRWVSGAGNSMLITVNTVAAGTIQLLSVNQGNTLADINQQSCVMFGDQ